jgi:hypothetical protein
MKADCGYYSLEVGCRLLRTALPELNVRGEKAMATTVHGKVQGRTIVLDEPLGLPLGQEVEVVVTPVAPRRPWGEGIRRSADALADVWTDDDDRILAEIHEDRRRSSSREIAE